jgi:mRNA interferase HigB
MRVAGRRELSEFMVAHADARPALQAWLTHVLAASWNTPGDVLQVFPRTSFISDGLAVFDIKGNAYRLVARIDFTAAIVRIARIGTHAEYDRWRL